MSGIHCHIWRQKEQESKLGWFHLSWSPLRVQRAYYKFIALTLCFFWLTILFSFFLFLRVWWIWFCERKNWDRHKNQPWRWSKQVIKNSSTTASSWVEGGCLGCPGASTLISQPLDRKTLPCLAIPATHPWATILHTGTSGHPWHCENNGKKKGGRGREIEK